MMFLNFFMVVSFKWLITVFFGAKIFGVLCAYI